ncbi:E3 SUMO-protein ligase NSE2 isoform X2 [Patagioenas fasciata]|uniref:E3 SUMO-protein ligase NSE2 isoform X2 n=1 Tax=Patagioenas fasciata TaxID=372321 RepID=UPI0032E89EF8
MTASSCAEAPADEAVPLPARTASLGPLPPRRSVRGTPLEQKPLSPRQPGPDSHLSQCVSVIFPKEQQAFSSNDFKMPGGARISFNCVDSALSSLKNCQSYINTGMDIATHVALDLVESFNDVEDVNSMENVMLQYAAMDRELKHYMKAIEETVNQIKREKPENIPDLKYLVKEKFTALESNNSDSDLQNNEKYIYFKDQLKEMRKQCNGNESIEQIDEDIAVTQSQTNFICPITQMEMKRPVRNKVCGHIYEEDAILKIIQTRKQQRKKVRCPKIGCSHVDVKGSDLVRDEALKRAIDSQKKQSWSTLEKSDGDDGDTKKICC